MDLTHKNWNNTLQPSTGNQINFTYLIINQINLLIIKFPVNKLPKESFNQSINGQFSV